MRCDVNNKMIEVLVKLIINGFLVRVTVSVIRHVVMMDI